MRLSHVNVPMERGREADARRFYRDLLGLPEVPKPEPLRARGGCWFDAGGIDVHLSVSEEASSGQRHFGLECADVDAMRSRLRDAGFDADDGRPAPWKRFFVRDPFGNRIEVHERGAMRMG